MKKVKLLFILLICLTTSGCFKKDNLEGIDIITTYYPIEWVTNVLYGEHANISSIFPNGTDSSNYSLTNKRVNEYSNMDLLIYNGATKDKETAYEFLNKNKKLLIIDASFGMEITYGPSELWLNPSNLLMISQNIKNGLQNWNVSNNYLEKEIEKNYESLKVSLSEIDAELRLTGTNANRKTIVTNSDVLKFLEKYGFEVISLDTTNSIINDKTLNTVNNLIMSDNVKHIIILENERISDELQQIIDSTKVGTYTFRKIDTITDEERENKDTYLTIMNQNIEILKSELY